MTPGRLAALVLAAAALAPPAGATAAAAAAQHAPAAAAARTPAEALAAARHRWARRHVRDYRYQLTVRCFCRDAGDPALVTVHGRKATGARAFGRTIDTVPEMFARIEQAIAGAQKLHVRYDARCGFPRSVSIDPAPGAIDDEMGWSVEGFHAPRRRR